MKAIILKEFGGVENLALAEIPTPDIADDEVLVKTKAISINPVDVKTRSGGGIAGRIRHESPIILGWDISGEVIETGSKVTHLKKGDNVFAMIAFPNTGKAYAAYVVAKANELAIKPGNISHIEAAAGAMAALTAWQALADYEPIQHGNRVLIHAASGGVGHYAVQIAKYLGAYVIGTSSAANRNFVLGLGADEHIDYRTQTIETATENIDFVLDAVGGHSVEQSLKVINKGGAIVSIVFGMSDPLILQANVLGIKSHNIMTQIGASGMEIVADLLKRNIIKSHISKVYPIEQMAEAHLQLESGRTVGKVVLTV